MLGRHVDQLRGLRNAGDAEHVAKLPAYCRIQLQALSLRDGLCLIPEPAATVEPIAAYITARKLEAGTRALLGSMGLSRDPAKYLDPAEAEKLARKTLAEMMQGFTSVRIESNPPQ